MSDTPELNIMEVLRVRLQPKGSKPLVKVQMNSSAYFASDFIESVLDELEGKLNMTSSDLYEMSPMDVLVIHLLKDSADL